MSEHTDKQMLKRMKKCLEYYKTQNAVVIDKNPSEPIAYSAGFYDGWKEFEINLIKKPYRAGRRNMSDEREKRDRL